jgi:SAM-dependent methyltransferase
VAWYYAIAERDHDIQNPTSAEKIRLMGEWLRLGPETRVLDIASGKGGPALVLASSFGCRITGVERYTGFAATARERVAEAGLGELIEVVESDGREFPLEPESWDVALCLGATFVWDDLDGTLSALVPAVRAGGHVAGARVERHGVTLIGLISSSTDDWDRYESLHWRAVEDWLVENDDQDIRLAHEEHKRQYLARRDAFGWAIFLARKPG